MVWFWFWFALRTQTYDRLTAHNNARYFTEYQTTRSSCGEKGREREIFPRRPAIFCELLGLDNGCEGVRKNGGSDQGILPHILTFLRYYCRISLASSGSRSTHIFSVNAKILVCVFKPTLLYLAEAIYNNTIQNGLLYYKQKLDQVIYYLYLFRIPLVKKGRSM